MADGRAEARACSHQPRKSLANAGKVFMVRLFYAIIGQAMKVVKNGVGKNREDRGRRPKRVTSRCALFLFIGISSLAREHQVASVEEFQRAVGSAQPGEAIVFKNGTWRDVKLNFRARGEAEKPLTLRAETPGRVIFQGSSE